MKGPTHGRRGINSRFQVVVEDEKRRKGEMI